MKVALFCAALVVGIPAFMLGCYWIAGKWER